MYFQQNTDQEISLPNDQKTPKTIKLQNVQTMISK